MKKVMVMLFVMAAVGTNAQELNFGVKAGANISTIDVTGDKAKGGFSGGVLG